MEISTPKQVAGKVTRNVFFAPVILAFLIGSLPILLPTLLYRAIAGTRK